MRFPASRQTNDVSSSVQLVKSWRSGEANKAATGGRSAPAEQPEEVFEPMPLAVAAYQHGIYPRSEDVVAATRGLERGRVGPEDVDRTFQAEKEDFLLTQREAGLDYFSDGLLRWQDIFRPLVHLSAGLDA